MFGSAHEILVLITHLQKAPINTCVDIYLAGLEPGATGLNFGSSLLRLRGLVKNN